MPTYVRDEDRFDEMLEAIDEGMEEYINEVYEQTIAQIVSNMSVGKDAMGRRWPPTQDPDDDTPLVDTGRLMASVANDSTVLDSSWTMLLTSDLDYAKYHEFGAPGAGIPPRPFLQPGLQYALDITPPVFRDEVDDRIDAVLM